MNSTADPAEFSLSLRDYSREATHTATTGHCIPGGWRGSRRGQDPDDGAAGTWAHVELLVHLAIPRPPHPARAPTAGDHIPGGPPQVFDMLTCAHAEFGEISWFGFSMGPQPGGMYYVDNLLLEGVLPVHRREVACALPGQVPVPRREAAWRRRKHLSGRTVCPSTTKSCTMCVLRHDSVPWTTNVVLMLTRQHKALGAVRRTARFQIGA